MNRGARRAPIFTHDEHCFLFLDCLDDTVSKYGLEVHAYSLMPNHYHLLVRSPSDVAILSRAMRFLNSNYAQRLNRMHKWDGPLFRDRFRSQLVKSEIYLVYLFSYIHLNPVRAHLVGRTDEECWTSFRAYLELEPRPKWLIVDTLLDKLGDASFLMDYMDALHRKAEPWPDAINLRTGWVNWKEALSSSEVRTKRRSKQGGTNKREIASILNRACEISGAKRSDLRKKVHGPGANPARRFAVWVLDQSTTLTQKEIGNCVDMTASQVAKTLSRLKKNPPSPVDIWTAKWEEDTDT
ncbi:MAG: hypothetical protein GY847_26410 [Proteobacteria bacterium]|nr:hypothetical protein [Pseudomonadota bacterium]